MEQWPLTAEKLQAAEDLVMEQLAAGHIEPSNSPWNTPIFVIKKKSGKWRLLQDLRAINATMEDMGALQPGLPSPVAVAFQYNVIVTDLQDSFFVIPLADQDYKWFGFSLPSANFKQPYRSFQWKVLPQKMKNSPTLCQKFVDQAVKSVRGKYKDLYLIHLYLAAHKDRALLQQILSELIEALESRGLKIAPEKIQVDPPFSYLGRVLNAHTMSHAPL